MASEKLTEDTDTLQMAILGYQIEKEKIDAMIGEIQAQLKGKKSPASVSAGKPKPGVRRHLSSAARKRISIAQTKRWAEHHKRTAQAAKEA